MQETFVRLPGAAARLRKPGSGKSFVFSIARYTAMELLRKRGAAAPEPPPAEMPDGSGDFTRTVEAAELARYPRRARAADPGAARLQRLDVSGDRRPAGSAGQHGEILLRPRQNPYAERMGGSHMTPYEKELSRWLDNQADSSGDWDGIQRRIQAGDPKDAPYMLPPPEPPRRRHGARWPLPRRPPH